MVRVVYLAGDGRCGTTLLSQILGSYDGCLAVGELYDIWSECLLGERQCSCGVPLRDCEFWNSVLDVGFGGRHSDEIQRAIELRDRLQQVRHLPFVLYESMRTNGFERDYREYVEIVERLYLTIQSISGCHVIVDSSKLGAYAMTLKGSASIDVDFLQVVRDSRACAYSWRKLKSETLSNGSRRYMHRRPIIKHAAIWSLRNLVLASISRQFRTALVLRYEDLVRQPRSVMEKLANQLGLSGHERLWLDEHEVVVSASNHIFAGNPIRVESGTIRIHSDDEWRVNMPAWQQHLVYGLTLPARWRTGYFGSSHVPQQLDIPPLAETRVG